MEPVSTVLFSLFRGTPQHEDWIVSCLRGAWSGLLGERLASVCRPLNLEKSRLVVEVLDPLWSQALADLREEMLAKLQAATGGVVQSITFK